MVVMIDYSYVWKQNNKNTSRIQEYEYDPTQVINRSEKARIDWSQEMLQKYDRGASKHVYDIVTGNELWIYAYEPVEK